MASLVVPSAQLLWLIEPGVVVGAMLTSILAILVLLPIFASYVRPGARPEAP